MHQKRIQGQPHATGLTWSDLSALFFRLRTDCGHANPLSMRLSQWPQCLQSKTRYPQCKPPKAGRQPAQNGAKSPRSLSIGVAFGAWLVSGDHRPAGLAVELAVSTQGTAAALARHLVGCALADWCLPLPWASWTYHSPAGHSAGALVPSLLALPLPRSRARWARGGWLKSLTHPSRKPIS